MARRGGDRYASERWLVEQMAAPIAEELEREAYQTLVRDLMRLRYNITRLEAETEAYERTHGHWLARAKVIAYILLDQLKATVTAVVAKGDRVDIEGFVVWRAVKRPARPYMVPVVGGGMVEGVRPETTVPKCLFSKEFKRRVKENASRPAVPPVGVPAGSQNV